MTEPIPMGAGMVTPLISFIEKFLVPDGTKAFIAAPQASSPNQSASFYLPIFAGIAPIFGTQISSLFGEIPTLPLRLDTQTLGETLTRLKENIFLIQDDLKLDPNSLFDFASLFFANSTIGMKVDLREGEIPISGIIPNVSIDEDAFVCATVKVDEHQGQQTISLPHPIILGGFDVTALGIFSFAFTRVDVDDKNRLEVHGRGCANPFWKDLTAALMKSPMGKIFDNNQIKPVLLSHAKRLLQKTPGTGQSKEFGEVTQSVVDAAESFDVQINTPILFPHSCPIPKQELSVQGSVLGILEALKNPRDLQGWLKSIDNLDLYWPHVPLTGLFHSQIVKEAIASIHVQASGGKIEINLKDIRLLVGRPGTPPTFEITGNLDIRTERTPDGRFHILVRPRGLTVNLPNIGPWTQTSLSGTLTGDIGFSAAPDMSHVRWESLALAIDHLDLNLLEDTEIAPGTILESLIARGSLVLSGAPKQPWNVTWNITPEATIHYESPLIAPLRIQADIATQGHTILDPIDFTPLVAQGNIQNLSIAIDVDDDESVGTRITTHLSGNSTFDYRPADRFDPLRLTWNLSGNAGLSTSNLSLQLKNVLTDGSAGILLKNGRLLLNTDRSTLQLRADTEITNQGAPLLTLTGLAATLDGTGAYDSGPNRIQESVFLLKADQALLWGMKVEPKLSLDILASQSPITNSTEAVGVFQLTSSEFPLNAAFQVTARNQNDELSLGLKLSDPLTAGPVKITGALEIIAEGHLLPLFPPKDSPLKRGLAQFSSLKLTTPKPMTALLNDEPIVRNFKMAGTWGPKEPNRIIFSGQGLDRFPFQGTLRERKNKWQMDGRVFPSSLTLGSLTLKKPVLAASANFSLSDLIKTKKAPVSVSAKTDFSGGGKAALDWGGIVGFDATTKRFFFLTHETKDHSFSLSPTVISTLKKEVTLSASSYLNGNVFLTQKKTGWQLSGQNLGLHEGTLWMHENGEKKVIAQDISVGADRFFGFWGGALYCGGVKGCYGEQTVHTPGTPPLSIRLYADRVPLTRQTFLEWLKTIFKETP